MEEYFVVRKNAGVGISLFSHLVAKALSSAPQSLTSVFGMGTGGPSASSTPTMHFSSGDSCGNRPKALPSDLIPETKSCILSLAVYKCLRLFGDSCGNRPKASPLMARITDAHRFELKTVHRTVFLTLKPSRVRFRKRNHVFFHLLFTSV